MLSFIGLFQTLGRGATELLQLTTAKVILWIEVIVYVG